MAGFICLISVNILLNKAKGNELENRNEKEEIKKWKVEEQPIEDEKYENR